MKYQVTFQWMPDALPYIPNLPQMWNECICAVSEDYALRSRRFTSGTRVTVKMQVLIEKYVTIRLLSDGHTRVTYNKTRLFKDWEEEGFPLIWISDEETSETSSPSVSRSYSSSPMDLNSNVRAD